MWTNPVRKNYKLRTSRYINGQHCLIEYWCDDEAHLFINGTFAGSGKLKSMKDKAVKLCQHVS